MKLIVLGLARNIDQAELKKMFNIHGNVESCSIVLDKGNGASKGFGFVEMSDVKEANAAIAALNNRKIGGSRLRVKFSGSDK